MTQLQLYKYATWGLLSLNIAILAFFFLTKPKHPHHRGGKGDFRNEVIQTLDLNEAQERVFKTLAAEHHEQMNSINRRQHELLPPYFEKLSDSLALIDQSEIMTQFQQLERQKIEFTYAHFEEIKQILEKRQLSDFKKLMDRFVDKLLLDNEKKRGRPKDSK